MAENSKIEWTHHTFNPWRGCTKVSDGCKFCYAETLSGRNPATLGVWGPKGTRVIASESMWKEPVKWNKAAGERHRVFCASLADVFEGPDTMPEESVIPVRAARLRLCELIRTTPHLDWLLLTKRPENIVFQIGEAYSYAVEQNNVELYSWLWDWGHGKPPENVWLGTSVEDQKAADKRIPHLLNAPARVRFLSCEPLLGEIDLQQWLIEEAPKSYQLLSRCYTPDGSFDETMSQPVKEWVVKQDIGIHWIIVGGESGPNARPLHQEWVRALFNQCQITKIPFLFKQWGEWLPDNQRPFSLNVGDKKDWGLVHSSGSLRLVQSDGSRLPGSDPTWGDNEQGVTRVGKKLAGRLFDGLEWDQYPKVAQ